jgi:L-ascorbate metabolism protein UlaG (beta-lactamase superfamily)
MTRLFAATLLAVLHVRFIGNEAFRITDGHTTLYSDFPYKSGAFGYMTYPAKELSSVPADALMLVTHGHADHFDRALFLNLKAYVLAPPEVTKGLPADRVIAFGPFTIWRGVRIEAATTHHGNAPHASYLVSWNGLRLYFTGDTNELDPLLAQHNLDAAFVTPWLLSAAAQHRRHIDAKRVIVYHHRAGESVAEWQDRIVPKQGEEIEIGKN